MEYKDIIYTKEDGIATITLNRPDRMNSFSHAMTLSIKKAVEDCAADDSVRVLVITATGRAFCAGADVKNMAANLDQGEDKPMDKQTEENVFKLAEVLQNLEKPIIAAINGVAVGGGLDFACACDIRIASDTARFAEVFIRRGLIPGAGGTYFLPRLVGMDKACLLIWTGDMIDAREAERIGLVTKVVPHDELEHATRELAEKLAKGPPLAIRMAKRAIYQGLSMDLVTTLKYIAPMVRELWETEDHREGARAFVEKREPVFKGK